MIKLPQYIKLLEVLSRVTRHTLLKNVTLEAAILYTLDFIHAVGSPQMFLDKETTLTLHNYRTELPCDLVSINLVMNMKNGICLRATTDTFDPTSENLGYRYNFRGEDTFKVQNTILISSIKEGDIKISYKAVPVDEDGFPLVSDNPTYLKALELYIKNEVFSDLFDEGTIGAALMNKALIDYAFKVGQLVGEMNIPSESEMEAICRSWTTPIQRVSEFDSGWKYNGSRSYLRRH